MLMGHPGTVYDENALNHSILSPPGPAFMLQPHHQIDKAASTVIEHRDTVL